jgi:CRP-like cAMP-binding protein
LQEHALLKTMMLINQSSRLVRLLCYRLGSTGEEYYILEKGDLEVLVFDDTGKNVKFTKKLNEKEGFGELALIYNCPRTASIVV